VVVRQGGWCYQGGQDSYRLGYVSGHFTYMRADFVEEIVAQAGQPSQASWSCNEWVDRFQAGELSY